MGGLMSGFQGARKLTTVEVLNIDMKKMNIKRSVNFNNKVTWENGSSIGLKKLSEDEIALYYTNTVNEVTKKHSYSIDLEYTDCNYGGERVWFVCPECGERARKLYLRNGVFKCRRCQNLNYSIQQEDKRDYIMESIDHKIYRVQDKLKTKRDIENIFFIEKPKGMHWETYEKLARQLRNLHTQRENAFISIFMGYKTGVLKEIADKVLRAV